ncbi:MAG: hypothetical protein LBC29_03460 [Propionibacteriaceae bacterium]|nr:hypothetical protein [Propionibacteriaceae bacterium]
MTLSTPKPARRGLPAAAAVSEGAVADTPESSDTIPPVPPTPPPDAPTSSATPTPPAPETGAGTTRLGAAPTRWRTTRIWLGVAAGCGVFSFGYEQFSHGVISWWMVFLFAWPLLLGALPYAVIALRLGKTGDTRYRYPWTRLLYAAGVAALTLGSASTGVFQIFGSPSDYTFIYWVAGSALLLAAAVSRLLKK